MLFSSILSDREKVSDAVDSSDDKNGKEPKKTAKPRGRRSVDVFCRVDGCTVLLDPCDLRSKKVTTCRAHQRENEVQVDGKPHRFCQQCMRVHPLDFFDSNRRSCKSRLQRQSARRKRKGAARRAGKLEAMASLASSTSLEQQTLSTTQLSNTQLSNTACLDDISCLSHEDTVGGLTASQHHYSRQHSMCSSQSFQDPQFFGFGDDFQLDIRRDMARGGSSQPNSEVMMGGRWSSQTSTAPAPLGSSGGVVERWQDGPVEEDLQLSQMPDMPVVETPHHPWPQQGGSFKLDSLPSNQHICVGPGCRWCRDSVMHSQAPDFFGGEGSLHDPLEGMGGFDHINPPVSKPADSSNPYQELWKNSMPRLCVQEDRILNISLKIYGATPEDLPPDFFHELLMMLKRPPEEIQGSLRPGCVQLSIDATMMHGEDYQAALAAFENLFPSSFNRHVPWATHDVDIKLPDTTIQVRNGAITRWGDHPKRLEIADVEPLACVANDEVLVHVRGLSVDRDFTALCRANGHYHDLEVTDVEWYSDGSAVLTIRVPASVTGMATLELMEENPEAVCLSTPAPLLVTTDAVVAEEISMLKDSPEKLPMHQAAEILRICSRALHPEHELPQGPASYALAASTAASFGWPLTLEAILERALNTVLMADIFTCLGGSNSLLTSAVISGDNDVVDAVIDVLEDEGALDTALQASISGMTVLHWAAVQGRLLVIDTLLDRLPLARDVWRLRRGGPQALTPMQILQAHKRMHVPSSPLPEGYRLPSLQEQPESEQVLIGHKDPETVGWEVRFSSALSSVVPLLWTSPSAVTAQAVVIFACIFCELSWSTAAEGGFLAALSMICLQLLLPVSYTYSYMNPLAACQRAVEGSNIRILADLSMSGSAGEVKRPRSRDAAHRRLVFLAACFWVSPAWQMAVGNGALATPEALVSLALQMVPLLVVLLLVQVASSGPLAGWLVSLGVAWMQAAPLVACWIFPEADASKCLPPPFLSGSWYHLLGMNLAAQALTSAMQAVVLPSIRQCLPSARALLRFVNVIQFFAFADIAERQFNAHVPFAAMHCLVAALVGELVYANISLGLEFCHLRAAIALPVKMAKAE